MVSGGGLGFRVNARKALLCVRASECRRLGGEGDEKGGGGGGVPVVGGGKAVERVSPPLYAAVGRVATVSAGLTCVHGQSAPLST